MLGMLVGWGVHKGHNRVLRDFRVYSGSLYKSGSYPADDPSVLFRASKDGASLIHM